MVGKKRGPAPTPKEVLNARGSWRGKKSSDEVTAPPGCPDCPEWLDDYGRERWEQLADELAELRVLSVVDFAAMAIHADTWSKWRHCNDDIASNGGSFYVLKTENSGDIEKELPSSIKAKQLVAELNRQLASFGLNPSARSNLKREPEEKPAGGLKRYGG